MEYTKEQRLEHANQLINVIASYGRRFYYHGGNPSRFILKRGHVYYVDGYTKKEIYTTETKSIRNRWTGFCEGGTLLELAKAMAHYIRTGEPITIYAIAHPHWGYSEDAVDATKRAAVKIPIIDRLDYIPKENPHAK